MTSKKSKEELDETLDDSIFNGLKNILTVNGKYNFDSINNILSKVKRTRLDFSSKKKIFNNSFKLADLFGFFNNYVEDYIIPVDNEKEIEKNYHNLEIYISKLNDLTELTWDSKFTKIFQLAEKNLATEINLIENPIRGRKGPPCPKCKDTDTVAIITQDRSGDEPLTSFNTCKNCKHTWRVNS